MTMKHFIVIQNKVKQKKTAQMMKQLKTLTLTENNAMKKDPNQ